MKKLSVLIFSWVVAHRCHCNDEWVVKLLVKLWGPWQSPKLWRPTFLLEQLFPASSIEFLSKNCSRLINHAMLTNAELLLGCKPGGGCSWRGGHFVMPDLQPRQGVPFEDIDDSLSAFRNRAVLFGHAYKKFSIQYLHSGKKYLSGITHF